MITELLHKLHYRNIKTKPTSNEFIQKKLPHLSFLNEFKN